MEMCYNEIVSTPKGCIMLDANEMDCIEGGVSLKMKRGYLNKTTCKKVGAQYAAATGLSKMRIAKEVYAHAVIYYASSAALIRYSATLAVTLGVTGVAVDASLLWMRKHANPIDIGNDSAFRDQL